MYKVGYRLLCKVDKYNLTKDRYYVIVNVNVDSDNIYIVIVDDKGIYFYFSDVHWINDHFYTKEEERLMKLERINNEI